MRKIPLAVFASLLLSGCAKPLLNIPEPTEELRTQARATLDSATLAEPARPFTVESMKEGYATAFSRVVFAVNRVCKRLEPTMKDLRCEAAITMPQIYRSDQVNAFADEYNNIGVSGALLTKVRVEAELAAVLAHEYAHIMLGHVEKKMKNALAGAALAGGLAGAYGAMTRTDSSQYAQGWMTAGMIAGGRAYSPEMEIEADRLAVYILNDAGYPPTAMRDAIVRMHRITPPKRKRGFSPRQAGFLDTHPSNDRRIAHILSAIRDVRAGVPVEAHARESP